MQEEQISMAMGRLKHFHLVLMLGISLLIPLLMVYSIYVDLSGAVFLSSDMSFENPDNEDLSGCQDKIKVFVPAVSSTPSPLGTYLDRGCRLISPALTSPIQITPALRC